MKSTKKKKKVLVDVNGSVQDCIDDLCKQADKFSLHLFTAKWQRDQLNCLKKNLPAQWLVTISDFAENYRCSHQDEISAAYYCYTQATLLTMVLYYRCPDCPETVEESIVFITSDLEHDAHVADKAYTMMLNHLKNERRFVPSHHVKCTDGCSTQFKSKVPFLYMTQRSGTECMYFGSRHGKSVCDGLGGTVKRCAERYVKSRQGKIRNAREMYDWAVKLQTIEGDPGKCTHKKRNFLFADKIDRPEPSNLIGMKGTRQVHQVKAVEPGIVQARRFACFCSGCLNNTKCINTSINTDWWATHDLQKVKRKCRKRKNSKLRSITKSISRKTPSSRKGRKVHDESQLLDCEPNTHKTRNSCKLGKRPTISHSVGKTQVGEDSWHVEYTGKTKRRKIASHTVLRKNVKVDSDQPECGSTSVKTRARGKVRAKLDDEDSDQPECGSTSVKTRARGKVRIKLEEEDSDQPECGSTSVKTRTRGKVRAKLDDEDADQPECGRNRVKIHSRHILQRKDLKIPSDNMARLEPLSPSNLTIVGLKKEIDGQSMKLLPTDVEAGLYPVNIIADGNCLSRCTSLFAYGDESHYKEMKLRLYQEMFIHEEFYTTVYCNLAMYSQHFTQGMKLQSDRDLHSLCKKELKSAEKEGAYLGIWHLAAYATILNRNIMSVYPQYAGHNVRDEYHRIFKPRTLNTPNEVIHIMWTHTRGRQLPECQWSPNHFVPLLRLHQDVDDQDPLFEEEVEDNDLGDTLDEIITKLR